MSGDMREKLRRLGVFKGTAHLKAPARPPAATPVAALTGPAAVTATGRPTPFETHTIVEGGLFIRRTRHALDHVHGEQRLSSALVDVTPLIGGITPAGNEPFALRDALFLDTETTGLVTDGTGVLAFLVGVGYFVADGPPAFVVDQYFLADANEEPAMLTHLEQRIASHRNLVTFNGRLFDVQLLEARYLVRHLHMPFEERRHLDLLYPARRVWRRSLTSCSLSSLEYHILGVRREQLDIPGYLVPELYREYRKSKDFTDMERVMYHNLLDVLSMVTLATRLHEVFTRPVSAVEHLAQARQHEANGQLEQAVAAYRTASASEASARSHADRRATRRLAVMLKGLGRNEEALEYWEMLADAGDVDAQIELAKYYEWTARDYARALDLAADAYVHAATAEQRGAIAHRLARLRRKMAAAPAPDPAPAAASAR